jgi:autoinducer 2-degrading protein
MFTIVATLYPKPEHRDFFLDLGRQDAISSVRDEPGCVRFEVHENADNPEELVFIESYHDEAAFDAHTKMPHFADFFRAIHGKSAKPPQVLKLKNSYPADDTFK